MAGEAPGQTIVANPLVHEAYLKIVKSQKDTCWESRRHFHAAFAEVIRRIFIDRVCRKKWVRDGGKGSYRIRQC